MGTNPQSVVRAAAAAEVIFRGTRINWRKKTNKGEVEYDLWVCVGKKVIKINDRVAIEIICERSKHEDS